QGARRAPGGARGRAREPARFLLDAPRRLRQSPRPGRAVRSGLPHLLAQSAAPREDAGADAAGFAPQEPEKGEEMNRRLAEALQGDSKGKEEEGETELELDSAMTFSAQEALREMDFEKMSNDEVAAAKKALEKLALPLADLPTRRFAPDPRGARVDLRASMRAQLRAGGIIQLRHKERRTRPPPLVVLCDISGSMSRYSRIFLHFMHAITNDRDRVYTFLFGTRLSNVTRYLR